MVKKITPGFVIQTYDGKNCIAQEFVAGDSVDYENEEGDFVAPIEDEVYQPFDMVEPKPETLRKFLEQKNREIKNRRGS